MITKKELLEKIEELRRKWQVVQSNAFDELTEWIEPIPDDESGLLPFEYPVKECYEVVTGDERKVGQLHKFEVEADFPVVGILDGNIESWTNDGRYSATGISMTKDLFLRRVEKKVWVVEWETGPGLKYTVLDSEEIAKGVAKTSTNSCEIYEAILKPVK